MSKNRYKLVFILFFLILTAIFSGEIAHAKDNNINKIGVYIFGTIEEIGRHHSTSDIIDYLAKEKNFIECYKHVKNNITKYQKGMKVSYESNGKIVLKESGYPKIYFRIYGGDNWATYLLMDTEDSDLTQIEGTIYSAQNDLDDLITEISNHCLKDKNYFPQKNMLLVNIYDYDGDFKLSCKPDKISYRLDCSDSVEYSNIAELIWDLDKKEHDIEESTYFLYQKRAPRTVILDRLARKDYGWGEGIWISKGKIFEDNFRCGLAEDLVEYPIEHLSNIQSEKTKIQEINSEIKQKIKEKEELISDLSKDEKKKIKQDYRKDIEEYVEIFNNKTLRIKDLEENKPRLSFSDFAIDYYKRDKDKLISETKNELGLFNWNFQQLKDSTNFLYTYSNQIESNFQFKSESRKQITMLIVIFVLTVSIQILLFILESLSDKKRRKILKESNMILSGLVSIFLGFIIGIRFLNWVVYLSWILYIVGIMLFLWGTYNLTIKPIIVSRKKIIAEFKQKSFNKFSKKKNATKKNKPKKKK